VAAVSYKINDLLIFYDVNSLGNVNG